METNWTDYNINNNNKTIEQRSSSIDHGQNLTTASPQKEARTTASPFSQSSEIECDSSSRKHLLRDSLDVKKNPEEKRRLSFDETLGFVDDSNSTCCHLYQDCLHRGSVSCPNRRPRRSSVYSGTHRRASNEFQQVPTHQPWGFSMDESKNSLTPVHEEPLDKGLKPTDDKSHLTGLTSSTAATAAATRLFGKNDSLGQQEEDQTKDLEPSAMTYGQEFPQEAKVHSKANTQNFVEKNNQYSTDNAYGQPKSLQKEVPILNSTDGSYSVSNTKDNSRFVPLSTNDSPFVEDPMKQSPETYGSPMISAKKSAALEGNTKEENKLGKKAVEESNTLRTTTFGQDASSDQTSPDDTVEPITLGRDALVNDQGSALNSNTFGQGTPAEPMNPPADDAKPMKSSISNRPKGFIQTEDSFTDPALAERAQYPLNNTLDNHTPPLDSDQQVVQDGKNSLGILGTAAALGASTFATQKLPSGDSSKPVNKWVGRPENRKQVEPVKRTVSQTERNDESISSTQAINGETSSDESNRLKKLASKNEGSFKSRAAAGGAALSSAFRRFSHGSSRRMSDAEVYKQSQSGPDWTGQSKTDIPDSIVLAESSGPETDDSMHSRQRYPSANEPMKMGPDYDPRSVALSSVPPKEESKNVLATIADSFDQHAFGGGHAFGTEDGRNQKTEIDEIDNNKNDTRRKSRKGSLQKVFGKLFHKNVS
ncbi:unnamed protein product [Rhizopus stolonifer]